jgi:hypothetical protein
VVVVERARDLCCRVVLTELGAERDDPLGEQRDDVEDAADPGVTL